MAENSISFFAEKLGVLVSQQASLFGAVEGQVRQLRNELEWIRQFLEFADAERRYDKMFKLWVNQIRDAAYDAEDVIDEFVFKLERKRQKRFNNLKSLNLLPRCIGLPDKLPLVNKLNERIIAVNTTLEKILINKGRYGMEDPRAYEAGSSSTSSEPWKEKRVIPNVEETNIVGMKNDVDAVKIKLLEGEEEKGVVAIVGMGGLGKTTLAKKIYNDSDIQHHFDRRVWVSVSQEFSIRELLLGIANCVGTILTDKQKHEFGNHELGQEVYKSLQGKRYLIVFDDVWNTDVWGLLSSHFPTESNRSRVLITTRNEHIAVDAHSDCYKLQLLDDGESWELFLNKVGSGVATWAGLEEFREGIVAKCKGLPLAIVVLGGLLSLKDLTLDSWRKVLKSMDWHLSQGPHSCLGILALSYNNLPSYLKPCFLYCGVFPEDSEIKASKLIRLWIAEGFVQERGKETVEEIAEDYLSELIQRSMIQVDAMGVDGRVKSCRMHDLLRDLAISEAKEENFFEVDENIDGNVLPTGVRRWISNIGHQIISPRNLQNSNTRSLILTSPSHWHWHAGIFWQKYPKLLRVLHLDAMGKVSRLKLSGKIGELIHLKFICLIGFSLKIKLPSSIERLVNLQTLEASSLQLVSIPHTVWKLQQMRHLTCGNGLISSRQSMRERWVYGHLGFHKMPNLQTLSLRSGDWLKDDNLNLGKLTNLKQLKLRKIDHRSSEGLFRSISQLTGLRRLELITDLGKLRDEFLTLWDELSASNAEQVEYRAMPFPDLESFSGHKCLCRLFVGVPIRRLPVETTLYPPNLMQLKLFQTRLKEDPMPILGTLPNLRILRLFSDSYIRQKMNCPHGGFPVLEFLQMQKLQWLEDFSIEETAMPNLKNLAIQSCSKITRLPDGLLQLEKLQRLNLYGVHQELMNAVSDTPGQDWNRIRLITSHTRPDNFFWSNYGSFMLGVGPIPF